MTVGSPDDSGGIHFSQAPKHTVDQPVTHAALGETTNCAPRTTFIGYKR